MIAQGWVGGCSDGSARRVRGWMQAGYGFFYMDQSEHNFAAHLPERECQSVSCGELRGVLHACYREEWGSGWWW